MSIPRWTPRAEITKQEERRLKSLGKTRKLLVFLRLHRTRLFDEAFQAELASMYRDTGEGMEPVAPALLAMTMLLQGYEGLGDARAIERTWSDKGWQMVLDLDGDEPAFGQGTLSAFRERLIAHDMDRRMLERTVELAKETGAFDWKKLPKTLRLAVDSRPLTGAGRVEDTFNLIAHAARKLLASAAALAGHEATAMAKKTGAPLLASGSIKAKLDIEWSDGGQKAAALGKLLEQVEALEEWVREHLPEQAERPPLSEHLATLKQLREQDLEPDPSDPSGQKKRIRDGVAEDRRISIEEPEMRQWAQEQEPHNQRLQEPPRCGPRHRAGTGMCRDPRQSAGGRSARVHRRRRGALSGEDTGRRAAHRSGLSRRRTDASARRQRHRDRLQTVVSRGGAAVLEKRLPDRPSKETDHLSRGKHRAAGARHHRPFRRQHLCRMPTAPTMHRRRPCSRTNDQHRR
jgi:hypothetical protein